MLLSNFVTQTTNDVDFSVVTPKFFPPLHVVIIVAVALVIVSVIFGVAYRNIELGFNIALAGTMIAATVFFLMGLVSLNSGPDYDTKKFQAWAQSEYLVDITEGQADHLIRNQIDLSKEPSSDESSDSVFVKNAYGEIVELTLIKDGDNWTLFQSDNQAYQESKG